MSQALEQKKTTTKNTRFVGITCIQYFPILFPSWIGYLQYW